jgi:hypothetical protein
MTRSSTMAIRARSSVGCSSDTIDADMVARDAERETRGSDNDSESNAPGDRARNSRRVESRR